MNDIAASLEGVRVAVEVPKRIHRIRSVVVVKGIKKETNCESEQKWWKIMSERIVAGFAKERGAGDVEAKVWRPST